MKNRNNIIKMFLRFLKDRGIYKLYIRNFNEKEFGSKYRKYCGIGGDSLIDFLIYNSPCDYFSYAFVWRNRKDWANIKNDWNKLLKKSDD